MNDDDRDDADLASEDLDAFLLLLESRLRSDFASPDLARLVASQGTFAPGGRRGGGAGAAVTTLPSGQSSSPSIFLRLLRKVFRRAAKPIKLRSLMSVLGMESDDRVGRAADTKNGGSLALPGMQPHHDDNELEGRRTDAIVWKLLQDAEADDEMWVRVVAGIIRAKMFHCTVTNGSGGERETEAEKQLGKITKGILDNTQQAMEGAEERRKEAKAQLADDGNGNGNNERLLETFQIGRDLCPAYVPVRYTLLPPAAITSIMPEVDANTDFSANVDAEILKVDAEVERKRAAEEGKELPGQAPGGAGMAVNGANGVAGRGTGVAGRGVHGGASRTAPPVGGRGPGAAGPGRMRGRVSHAGGRGAGRGAAASGGGASLFRPSATVGRGAGRGGLPGRTVGRAGGRFGGAGRAGRSGSLSRLVSGRASSSAAAATRAPLPRRAPGAARALLAASGRSAGGGGGEASKMKLIDASEAEGLSQRQREWEAMAGMSAVEARKLERKRKLMEDAKASGLRNGREKRTRPAAGAEVDATGENVTNGQATDATAGVPPNQSSAPTDAPGAAVPTSEGQQLDSLLEKSNKLSPDAYQHIHAFFHHRAASNHRPQPPLPLPEGGDASTAVWKVKLNEEKTVDPSTGESVKETLYLELDYRSLGYKKTRKIKRK